VNWIPTQSLDDKRKTFSVRSKQTSLSSLALVRLNIVEIPAIMFFIFLKHLEIPGLNV